MFTGQVPIEDGLSWTLLSLHEWPPCDVIKILPIVSGTLRPPLTPEANHWFWWELEVRGVEIGDIPERIKPFYKSSRLSVMMEQRLRMWSMTFL